MNLYNEKIIVAIENAVQQQVEASGVTAELHRLDGEKIVDAIIGQLEGFVLVPKNTIDVLEELTQLSSYAEIVGGISVNRAAIRGQCDIAFNLIREFEDAEFLKEFEAQEQSHD